MSGIDLIGDVHAQGERLEALLEKMGYHGLKHPEGRKIIFLGDFIDRGNEHVRVINLVRRLMDKGTARAVMGNHEFNAICYAREGKKGYIRPHTPQNTGQQAQFLEEYPFQSPEHKEVIKFFETLPLFLETKDFRVVHACWSVAALKACKPHFTRANTLKKSAYAIYDENRKSKFYKGLEILIKAPEFRLPEGMTYEDVSNVTRSKTRLLWWEPKDPPTGAPANHMIEKGHIFPQFEGSHLKRAQRLSAEFSYVSDVPVFIGHYNIAQPPYLTAQNVACVNFKNHMVAYRWDEGDKTLDPAKLVHL